MSREDVETCRRTIAAYNRRDVDAFVEEFDPAVEWRPLNQVMFGGEAEVYRGHEGVRRFMREVNDAFAEVQIEELEIHDLDERIVMSGRLRAFGRSSGAPTESAIGWVVEMKDARIIRMRDYLDPAEALRAAGEPR
jgi:ketosteroid isomerase-like protein